MTRRSYATVNPCVMCQPMGSVLAFKGVEDSMVLMHGSQGCSTYMRLHLAHHFREPVDIASSSLSERGAVYGGSANLKQGLKNVMDRYHPRVIGVATTCMAETIGDDVPAIIREFEAEEEPGDSLIIPVSTPSYSGTHVNGYTRAAEAIVRYMTSGTPGLPSNRVNIIPSEYLSPADIREIKQMASDILGAYIFYPDISDTFDAPVGDHLPKIARGGTPLREIADMYNSKATIGLGGTRGAVEYLCDTFKLPSYNVPMPIGLGNTDKLLDVMSHISGLQVPEKYVNERGRLLDAMVDVHKYLYGVRTALYGDPETVLGLLSFILELGMYPVLVASGSKSPEFEKTARNLIDQMGPSCQTTVLEGMDFDTFNDAIRNTGADLLLGNSNGKYISQAEHIPLVRMGLPIHDRVGAPRLLSVGYRGAMVLIDRITNTLLEARERKGTAPADLLH